MRNTYIDDCKYRYICACQRENSKKTNKQEIKRMEASEEKKGKRKISGRTI